MDSVVIRERLLSLGISVGQIFQVSHTSKDGPTVISIDTQRIALDATLAEQIMVLPKPETEHAVSSAIARLKQIWSLPS